MLQIVIPGVEYWDEAKETFGYTKEQTLQLEHSLVSLSKWESKWCKPFLSSKDLSREEILDYIRCMTITKNVPPEVYMQLSSRHFDQINEYIKAPMTATTFREGRGGKGRKRIITAELIYYWMVAFNIPVEFQKWHLNRLLTLIRVCEIENSPKKKQSANDILRENAALNAARKAQLKTKG